MKNILKSLVLALFVASCLVTFIFIAKASAAN